MCDCNVRYLMDGTKKLVEWYQENPKYYYFINCSCGRQIDYVGDDVIKCINCKKVYCSRCQFNLVFDITHSTICDCTDSIVYYQCGSHYYCDSCQLSDCVLCDSDARDNCPKCCERYSWRGRLLCETHNELKDMCNYEMEDEHDFAPKTPEAWYQHNLSCFGKDIGREEYSKQMCDCKF